MTFEPGAPLFGCTAWISPIYMERRRSDVPIGGTIFISYEPFSKASPDLSKDSKDIYSPYEFEGHLTELLKSWIGIHDVISGDFGVIIVQIRPLVAQSPGLSWKMWHRIKDYLVRVGAELVPYTARDAVKYNEAYEAWAKQEE